jgi:ABC-type Co2+ transport system permease subunit
MYINFKNKDIFIWSKEFLQSFFLLGCAYAGIYFLNNALTGFLYLAPAAHLVHIPSGFKLLFVLMGRWAAAAAIACVSFLNAYFLMFEGNMILGLALACASGLAPLFTWLFFKHRLQIEDNLGNIQYKGFLAMGLFFAVLHSALHQLIVFWSGEQSDFAKGFIIMGIGDLTGLYTVLLIIKFISHFIPRPKSEA